MLVQLRGGRTGLAFKARLVLGIVVPRRLASDLGDSASLRYESRSSSRIDWTEQGRFVQEITDGFPKAGDDQGATYPSCPAPHRLKSFGS